MMIIDYIYYTFYKYTYCFGAKRLGLPVVNHALFAVLGTSALIITVFDLLIEIVKKVFSLEFFIPLFLIAIPIMTLISFYFFRRKRYEIIVRKIDSSSKVIKSWPYSGDVSGRPYLPVATSGIICWNKCIR